MIFGFFKQPTKEDKKLIIAIRQILGTQPSNTRVYKLALSHSSVAWAAKDTIRGSNERLEYLGDAILGAIIADYLFRKYPYKDEGFLTDIRSRIVNRESLNNLARKIGLDKLVLVDASKKVVVASKSIYGNALEAFVGAIYLDKGFKFCRKFILERLLDRHIDVDDIVQNNTNFKSVVIEWAHKESKELRFEIIEERGKAHTKEFIAQIFLDDKPVSKGSGMSKKKAEQAAAEKMCESFDIKGSNG